MEDGGFPNCKWGLEKERKRVREQTERQTDRQTDSQTDTRTDRITKLNGNLRRK